MRLPNSEIKSRRSRSQLKKCNLSNSKNASLPWSVKSVLGFGYLTRQQIDDDFNLDPATKEQTRNITIGLNVLREERRNNIARKESYDLLLDSLINHIEYVEKIHKYPYRKLDAVDNETNTSVIVIHFIE